MLTFFSMGIVILIVINILLCVSLGIRYRTIGRKGAARRIVLSWVVFVISIPAGAIVAGLAENARAPIVERLILMYLTIYVIQILAIIYTASGVISAQAAINSTKKEDTADSPTEKKEGQ